ncbi:hypothetical protein LCGC14_0895010 [marine sediment metagenome]|uniref:Uncharacterized protein n=1 Tax=marine sediment metagenome TaxID=412755 RepID=A0A0F9RHC6_9ZZZZ
MIDGRSLGAFIVALIIAMFVVATVECTLTLGGM